VKERSTSKKKLKDLEPEGSTMSSDKPISAFTDDLKRVDESAFEVTHRKEAGATTIPKQSRRGKPKQHNIHSNGVTGRQGAYTWNNLPYKGSPGDFKHDDPSSLQPALRHKACIKQFDCSSPDDLEEYAKVMQSVCDGTTTVSFEEKIYDKKIKSWRILLRYAESYYQSPAKLQE